MAVQKMIHLDKAVIVEGKYDKIKLSSIFDAPIIVTGGFGIYKSKETISLIKFYADNGGIIILTDSDSAGFQIRNHIKGLVSQDKITNVYIPEIFGKEKRKVKPSKAGTLGVEGVDKDIIIEAFKKAGVLFDNDSDSIKKRDESDHITKFDFYDLGLMGQTDSKDKRQALLKSLNLPGHISTNAMIDLLNRMMTKSELLERLDKNQF